MIKNYIKVTIRKIRKEFGYAMIVILSLTIGIVSSLMMLLYVFDDLSYDRYHENKDCIVRVVSHVIQPNNEMIVGTSQTPFGQQAKEDYPEIEEFVRISPLNRTVFIYNDIRLIDDYVYYADSSFFKIFSYDLIKGDPANALTRPNTLVVTESFSNKYFGGEDPFGKTIQTASGQDFEITGVMKDIPKNSHWIFSALISRTTLPERTGGWDRFGCSTYLLIKEGADYNALQDKMKEMYDKYMAEFFRQRNRKIEYLIEPLTDIYLKSDALGYFSIQKGEIKYVYIFSIVALFMLLIASINYINLATSRSTQRVKEVGLRKIAGSQRWTLILQFLFESIILTFFALILSIVIIIILLPAFNQITGKLFDINYLINAHIILALLGIVFIIGIIGGIYPAIYLARFDPASVIKQSTGAGRSNLLIRKILVILQFTISLVLIINTLVIHKQVRYMQNKELGFEPQNVIIVSLTDWQMIQQYPAFRNALEGNPNIRYISSAQNVIGYPPNPTLMLVETPEGMQQKTVNNYAVDYDFVKTMGIEIVQGRDFSRDFISDTISNVIINESLAKQFSWDEPLGKRLAFTRGNFNPFTVVGVMKDCHHLGLYNPIEPLMLMLWDSNNPIVTIKINDHNIQEALQFIESKWLALFPDHPFEYSFLEDDYAEQFKEDEKKGVLFTCFSALIILIACLGIIGLATFTMEQRTKEVAIRKVLGASVINIVHLISKEFLILVFISMVPAFAGAYFYMKTWLQDYPYSTKMDPWMFLWTGLGVIALTLISVSYSAIRTGFTNPAEVLRSE